MKFTGLLIALSFLGRPAHALEKVSPKFTYDSAAQAFVTATSPAAPQISDTWMAIGYVTLKGGIPNEQGYWPDGRTTIDGDSGFYYDYLTFKPLGTDAFGKAIFSSENVLVGAETGKIYDSYVMQAVLNDNGLRQEDGEAGSCAVTDICRYVANQDMLLCSVTDTGSVAGCQGNVLGKPNAFVGFRRKSIL